MTRVETLKKLQERVTAVLGAVETGPTGYIDQPLTPTESVMKGVDRHGRSFITLCARSEEQTERGLDRRCGVTTVFQRYSGHDAPDIVTQATNNGRGVQLLIAGAATLADLGHVEELIATGKTLITGDDALGARYEIRVELCTPEEATADPRRRPSQLSQS